MIHFEEDSDEHLFEYITETCMVFVVEVDVFVDVELNCMVNMTHGQYHFVIA